MLAAAEHKGLGIPLLAGVCLLCDVRAVLSLQSKQPPLIRVGPREVAQHECPSQILTLRACTVRWWILTAVRGQPRLGLVYFVLQPH